MSTPAPSAQKVVVKRQSTLNTGIIIGCVAIIMLCYCGIIFVIMHYKYKQLEIERSAGLTKNVSQSDVNNPNVVKVTSNSVHSSNKNEDSQSQEYPKSKKSKKQRKSKNKKQNSYSSRDNESTSSNQSYSPDSGDYKKSKRKRKRKNNKRKKHKRHYSYSNQSKSEKSEVVIDFNNQNIEGAKLEQTYIVSSKSKKKRSGSKNATQFLNELENANVNQFEKSPNNNFPIGIGQAPWDVLSPKNHTNTNTQLQQTIWPNGHQQQTIPQQLALQQHMYMPNINNLNVNTNSSINNDYLYARAPEIVSTNVESRDSRGLSNSTIGTVPTIPMGSIKNVKVKSESTIKQFSNSKNQMENQLENINESINKDLNNTTSGESTNNNSTNNNNESDFDTNESNNNINKSSTYSGDNNSNNNSNNKQRKNEVSINISEIEESALSVERFTGRSPINNSNN